MKKLATVGLAVLLTAVLLPQTLSAGFGIKGGYALSKFSITSVDPIPFELVNLPSPVGGIFFSVGLGPLAIQPEVLYARMGAKVEEGEDSLEWRMDYIQVPVLLKLSVIPAGPVRPFICGGGYGSYLIKATGAATIGGTTTTEDITEDFERYDYGVVAGAGLTLKIPGISFSLEGRYNYGLRNIGKDMGEGNSIKNRSIMALVGIGF